jgi:protein-S-isoprenylcysteine O-methyltransferase Ste14
MDPNDGAPGQQPPGTSRLPALGRRGGGWVAAQVVIFAGAAFAGWAGAGWPAATKPWLWIASAIAFVGGTALLLAGGAGLGSQLTPFPRPVPDGELRQDGIYGLVRHPIYGGVLLGLLGWALFSSPLALVPWAVGAVFFDAKRRREEAWLVAQYAEYEGYRQRVRRALIPFIW